MAHDDKTDANKDKLAGKAKKGVGKVTGDSQTQAEGQAQDLQGKAKEKATNAKESVKGFTDGLKKD